MVTSSSVHILTPSQPQSNGPPHQHQPLPHHLSERDILKLPIPKIPEKTAKEIITQIRQAHAARQEAQVLLAKAKRAIEVAIEEGEEKALNFLKP